MFRSLCMHPDRNKESVSPRVLSSQIIDTSQTDSVLWKLLVYIRFREIFLGIIVAELLLNFGKSHSMFPLLALACYSIIEVANLVKFDLNIGRVYVLDWCK